MTSHPNSPRSGGSPAAVSSCVELPTYNWDSFRVAYRQLRRCGLPHDEASDKALYLAVRGPLPDVCNWYRLACHSRINAAARADNSRCVSLFTLVGEDMEGQPLVLADVLPTSNPQ